MSSRAYGREPGEEPELPADLAAEADRLQGELEALEGKDDLSPDDEQAWHACRERLDAIEAWPEENIVYGDEVRAARLHRGRSATRAIFA